MVQDAARRIEDDVLRARESLLAARRSLPDGGDADLASVAVRLARDEVDLSERAARALPGLEADLARAVVARESEARALGLAREKIAARAGILANMRGAISALRADAPAEEGDSRALTRASEMAAATAASAAGLLDNARKELAAAREGAERARMQAAATTRRAAETATALADARAALHADCVVAGVAEVESARAARLPLPRAAALGAMLAAFDHDLAQASALAARSELAAASLARPDLAALNAAQEASGRMAREAADEAARLAERYELAARLIASIRESDAALADARARHGRLRDLAETTAGRNDRKLSLEGFVLASILDEALAAANEHLSRMLGGRYRVRRRDEPLKGTAAVGLDIEVCDDWTGTVRSAGTLSGGEGFCAALALALGLADTVQAHAGARRIDALFIDEGFGSLDEDALDTAMDVLSSLQAGDRLVGIISHVAELRGRIPAQLMVRPGVRGSSARFMTPES